MAVFVNFMLKENFHKFIKLSKFYKEIFKEKQ